MTTKEAAELGETWGDRAAALTKGGVGMVPIAGSILAAVVGLLIPNQRLARLEAYVRRLDERLKDLTKEELVRKIGDAQGADLFEEGAIQSSRALSEQRLDYIADAVARGLSGDDKERIESKRVLNLLRQIDDAQVIILASYLHRLANDEVFRSTHEAILTPVHAFIGSSQEEIDAAAMFNLARNQLVQLGLLQNQYSKPGKGEVPEFDDATGALKVRYRTLTAIGRLLLRHIGIGNESEF